MNIQELTTKILTEFEKSSVKYAVLRNYEDCFDPSPKDIDLLIDIKDESKIIGIIKRASKDDSLLTHIKKDHKRTVVSLLVKAGNQSDSECEVLVFDLNRYLTLKTNPLHSRINGLGLKIIIDDLEIGKNIPNKNGFAFSILSKQHEVILLLNQLLWKKKESYFIKVNMLLKAINISQLDEMFNNVEIYKNIGDVLKIYNLNLTRYQASRNIINLMAYFKYKLFAYKASRVIYFSGPDGAGKTATINWAIEYLSKVDVKIYRTKSLQFGTLFYLRTAEKIKSFYTEPVVLNDNDLDLIRPRDTGRIGWSVRRRVGLLVGLFEICIVARLILLSKKITGHVVLVEESPMDIFVKRHRPRVKLLENIFIPWMPLPNLSILCVAGEKAIHTRKPELYINEIIDYYYLIKFLYGKNKLLKMSPLPTDVSLYETKNILVGMLDEVLNGN